MSTEEATKVALEMAKKYYQDSLPKRQDGLLGIYGISPYLETADQKYGIVRKEGKIISVKGKPVSDLDI
jgi:hypothetical protein